MTCDGAVETAAPDAAAAARRLFLVGPMAAGKTTIGRHLARRLGLAFADSDREITRRAGVDVATIFDFEGEAGFREREHRILDELTRAEAIVVATGGGAILRADNRALLRERGFVVHLAISVDEQLRRTRRDRARPLLQRGDRRATLERLAAEREPLYRAVAHVTLATDGRRSRRTAERLLEQLPTSLKQSAACRPRPDAAADDTERP